MHVSPLKYLYYTPHYAEFDRNPCILTNFQLEYAVKVTALFMYLHIKLV